MILSPRDVSAWMEVRTKTIDVSAGFQDEVVPEDFDRVYLGIAAPAGIVVRLSLLGTVTDLQGFPANDNCGAFELLHAHHGKLCGERWFMGAPASVNAIVHVTEMFLRRLPKNRNGEMQRPGLDPDGEDDAGTG